MYTALVADDHPFIRFTLKMLLEQINIKVVAEADNGADAVKLARVHSPNIIILDICMPKLDGLEVLRRITKMRLPSKIIIFSSRSELFYSARCMQAGAAGFISKASEIEELEKVIKRVMDGCVLFPNMASSLVGRNNISLSDRDLIQKLSDRELTILTYLSLGYTNKEIGDSMLISNKTVSTYKTRLIEKINVKSVVYLADFAKRNGLV